MDPTHIVAAIQSDGSRTWQTAPSLLEAFAAASLLRSAGMREITVAVIKAYSASIVITSGGQTYELPIPDVEGG